MVCVLGSMPLALLTYPWLPATVVEFVELRHDPPPSATLSFREYRAQRLQHVTLALLLYGLGTVSLCGLLAIAAANALPWLLELTTWAMTAVTGAAIARFEYSTGPGADPAYVFMTVYLPSIISVIAAVGTGLHVVVHHRLAPGDNNRV
jgi:hypothetical protein